MGDLTSVSAALRWLGLSADPGYLPRLVSAASTTIQNWIGYQIASASYTRTFNGRGGNRIFLPDIPVTDVTSVTIAGIPIPASTTQTGGQTPGFAFDAQSVMLVGDAYCFWRGQQNVTVSYVAGYARTPHDLEQACLDLVKAAYERGDFPTGATEFDAGNMKVKYGETDLGVGLALPLAIRSIVQPYVRVSQ